LRGVVVTHRVARVIEAHLPGSDRGRPTSPDHGDLPHRGHRVEPLSLRQGLIGIRATLERIQAPRPVGLLGHRLGRHHPPPRPSPGHDRPPPEVARLHPDAELTGRGIAGNDRIGHGPTSSAGAILPDPAAARWRGPAGGPGPQPHKSETFRQRLDLCLTLKPRSQARPPSHRRTTSPPPGTTPAPRPPPTPRPPRPRQRHTS